MSPTRAKSWQQTNWIDDIGISIFTWQGVDGWTCSSLGNHFVWFHVENAKDWGLTVSPCSGARWCIEALWCTVYLESFQTAERAEQTLSPRPKFPMVVFSRNWRTAVAWAKFGFCCQHRSSNRCQCMILYDTVCPIMSNYVNVQPAAIVLLQSITALRRQRTANPHTLDKIGSLKRSIRNRVL